MSGGSVLRTDGTRKRYSLARRARNWKLFHSSRGKEGEGEILGRFHAVAKPSWGCLDGSVVSVRRREDLQGLLPSSAGNSFFRPLHMIAFRHFQRSPGCGPPGLISRNVSETWTCFPQLLGYYAFEPNLAKPCTARRGHHRR